MSCPKNTATSNYSQGQLVAQDGVHHTGKKSIKPKQTLALHFPTGIDHPGKKNSYTL